MATQVPAASSLAASQDDLANVNGQPNPQQQIPQNDGSRVPKESPNAPAQAYGPNNENLPERLQSALKMLVDQFRIEGLVARRHEILRVRRARYYWMGQQFLWFDWNEFDWRLPYQGGVTFAEDKDDQEQPRYDYVLNVYQAFGLAFIAVGSSQVPTVRWFPQSLNRSNDITAAKAASNAAALIEETNHIQQKMIDVWRWFWTDGKIGAYVRYVADKERFGEENVPSVSMGYSPLGEDGFVCPKCGQQTPVSAFALSGEMGGHARMEAEPRCPQLVPSPAGAQATCNTPLGADNFKAAPRIPVPLEGEPQSVARGQELITFVGALELATPPWCNDFWDYPFLQWQLEVHKGQLKAKYPHAADKIQANNPMSAEDVYGRASRLAVAQGLPVLQPGDVMYNLVTYLRTWLRRWAFDALDDKEIAQELKQLFPDGCYCAFAGDTYCESRNEKMGDHWRVMHTMPGDGSSHPAQGEAALDVQDVVNTIWNMLIEAFEYGIPPIYADSEVLDFEALTQRTVEPGVHVPARARQGQTLAQAFFQPTAAQIPGEMPQFLQELVGPIFQLVTGVTAAVFGGSMDDVKTAKAYQQARDMSLGRLGLCWNVFKQMYAEVMQLAVKCFRENRPGDVERVLPGENSEFESQIIKLADLDGDTQAQPDPDETYPQLRSQKVGVLQQLMTMAQNAPELAAMLTNPVNLGIMKAILGIDELDIPGDDARTHQLREIEAMRKAPGLTDPNTGQVMIPSVQPSLFENHGAHLAEISRWVDGDDGQMAKMSEPQWYSAVVKHGQLHQQMQQSIQMAMNAPAIAAAAAKGAAQGKPKEGKTEEQPQVAAV